MVLQGTIAFKEFLRINLKHNAFKCVLKARYKNETLHFGFPSTIISSHLPFLYAFRDLVVERCFSISLVLSAIPSDISEPGISPDLISFKLICSLPF